MGHGLNIPAFVKREYDENKGLGGRQLSFSCSKFAMDKAAQGGHVDVLQLLHEQVSAWPNHWERRHSFDRDTMCCDR